MAVVFAARAQPPLPLDAPKAVDLGAPTSTGRGALLMTSQLLALGAGGLVSAALGSVWIDDNFRRTGRPDPRVFSANVALALAVNMALTWALLPDLARLTNDRLGTADVAFVRRETIRRTWLLVLATGIFAGVLGVGSVVEKNNFGSGQLTMAVGVAGAAAGILAFDILALLTVREATNTSRQQSVIAP